MNFFCSLTRTETLTLTGRADLPACWRKEFACHRSGIDLPSPEQNATP